jgi:RNA polymerase sigma-70 factor (ECF subfamily)
MEAIEGKELGPTGMVIDSDEPTRWAVILAPARIAKPPRRWWWAQAHAGRMSVFQGRERKNDRVSDREIDLQLVERVRDGDKRAYGLLVEKYRRKLMRLLSRMVRDPDEVEDIAQETFIKAYRALPQFRGDAAFYTWLYRIAVNTAKNYLSSKGRSITALSDHGLNDEDEPDERLMAQDISTPESELLSKQVAYAVNEAVEALPEELRQAITLREIEGMSYEEIADAMACPIGTVRSRIFRAREAIAAKLRPILGTSEDRRW